MKIIIGNDHRGLKLKEQILKYLLSKNYDVENIGTDTEASVNYPEYALKLCEKVKEENGLGILICGTGIGMSIVANKVNGIRCGKVNTVEEAELTKSHNYANVIALSSKLSKRNAIKIVETFINTQNSSEERHIKRVEEIREIEKNNA